MKSSQKTRAGSSAPSPASTKESLPKAAARLSESLGIDVTIKMVRVWREKGYPLDDMEGLRAKLNNQERNPLPKAPTTPSAETTSDSLTPEEIDARIRSLERDLLNAVDYEGARTAKTQISGMRELLKVKQERGILMPVSDAETAGRVAGQASRMAWEKIEDELPPMLEGLTAAQMKAKLRDFARSKCLELSDVFASGATITE